MSKPQLPTADLGQNEIQEKEVNLDNPLKEWLVNYVGQRIEPENDTVTVGHIVEVMASDFPEFLMVVAEENWIRGYRQGIVDVEKGMEMAKSEGFESD